MNTLLDIAGRLWSAAWELDALRGDTAATTWTAGKVRQLMRTGQADDARAVLPLVRALEGRLAQDRDARPTNTSAVTGSP